MNSSPTIYKLFTVRVCFGLKIRGMLDCNPACCKYAFGAKLIRLTDGGRQDSAASANPCMAGDVEANCRGLNLRGLNIVAARCRLLRGPGINAGRAASRASPITASIAHAVVDAAGNLQSITGLTGSRFVATDFDETYMWRGLSSTAALPVYSTATDPKLTPTAVLVCSTRLGYAEQP